MKRLAVLFTFLILLIIILADLGGLPRGLRIFYDFPFGDKLGHLVLYGLLNFFITYNFTGGVAWVGLFTLAGFFFGTIPFVRTNFEFVIIAIILISVLPMVYEAWKARRESKAPKPEAETP